MMQKEWDTVTILTNTSDFPGWGGDHFLVDDWYQDDCSRVVETLCQSFKIDVVVAEGVFASKVFENLPLMW